MRNTRRLEDKPFTEVNLHDSISLLRRKMFPEQSLKGRFLHWKILPKAYYFPQFSITIVFVRHFGNEIPLTINHGREMSTISGNEVSLVYSLILFFFITSVELQTCYRQY